MARKIAKDARKLSRDRVDLVDRAVAAAALESPARLLAIAEAKIIEADPDAHRARLEEDAKRTGVWLSKVRPGDAVDEVTGEPTTRRITAKLPTGSAVRGDENVDDLAEAIYEHRPADEEGNRPTHAECRQAAFEMLLTDPHSTSRGVRRLDHDHATPWDGGGPPGQTGDLNDAPMTRKHHRAKTHRPYAVHQLGLGAYRWVTPHGLARVVTPLGTRKVELIRAEDSRVIGEVYPGPRIDYHPRR